MSKNSHVEVSLYYNFLKAYTLKIVLAFFVYFSLYLLDLLVNFCTQYDFTFSIFLCYFRH